MNMKCSILISVIVLAAMFTLASGALAADSTDHVKIPVILKAKEVLPEKLLRGKNFVVEDRVENDGLVNTYQLTTNYGPLKAESTVELVIRVTELHAMDSMEEMDRKKVFGDALVSGVKAPFQGAYNLVKAPVDTTKGIVKGTGRFLSNIGRSFVTEDPYQDNAFKVAIGYDTAKRGFAYEFGINPYSSNEAAVSMLSRVAQAAVAGGLAPKVAMAAVSYDVTTILQATGTSEGMRKLVRDNPPGELAKLNVAKLSEIGIPASLIDAFMSNYAYDPQEKTLLTGELERLDGVKGRDEFIAAAGLASDASVALFYRAMARMMAGYHARVSPAAGIERVAGTPILRNKDNAAVLLAPVDFVFRTAEVEVKVKKLDEALRKIGVSGKELWITGKVDGGAREMLAASGWKVVENAGDRVMKE